jgi:hypothetical protein
MITRVRKLTPSNISALDVTSLTSALGSTVADIDGSPVQALAKVTSVMAGLPMGYNYRSLQAVRRKLALAAPRWDTVKYDEGTELALTPFVTVVR